MKFCTHYKKDFEYYDLVDEIILKYEDKIYPSLIEFLEENERFRTKTFIINYQNIEITDEISSELEQGVLILKNLKKTYPSLKFKLKLEYDNTPKNVLNLLAKEKIPFFFSAFINNWDELYGFLDYGVSDVYITDDLGFELVEVSKLVHSYNAQVRVFPNIAQSTWETSTPIKKFFIRPEDIDFCSQYVDVFEIWGGYNKLNTIIKIYAVDKQWRDNLYYIIQELDSDINNACLLPDFITNRIDCGKKCLKGKSCNLCNRYEGVAKIIEQNGFVIED